MIYRPSVFVLYPPLNSISICLNPQISISAKIVIINAIKITPINFIIVKYNKV